MASWEIVVCHDGVAYDTNIERESETPRSQSTPKMVQRIDEQLLRRRSEHNDGELSTLREVTLHQFDIEKIENLDVYCRNLEILFLQGNQISKIENLNKLKRLEYLQLALNNIKTIENLEGCESLKKLDLTVNFIENLFCVESLVNNIHLEELYLVGNPCTQLEGCRKFIIATLPQLKSLDGKEIEKSERILAAQEYASIRASLLKHQSSRVPSPKPTPEKSLDPTGSDSSQEHKSQKVQQEPTDTTQALDCNSDAKVDDELAQKRLEFQNKPVPHTPEARLAAARDLALLKGDKTKGAASFSDPLKKKKERIMFAPDGRVLRKNEGSHSFKWEVTPRTISLTVEISKFMDTSLIDVDVHPTWLRVTIKGKILQLVTEEEVFADNVVCERSRLSGQLSITMLKVNSAKSGESDLVEIRRSDRLNITAATPKLGGAKAAEPQTSAESRDRRLKRLGVDYRKIVSDTSRTQPSASMQKNSILGAAGGVSAVSANIVDAPFITADLNANEDAEFEDDDTVPPLC